MKRRRTTLPLNIERVDARVNIGPGPAAPPRAAGAAAEPTGTMAVPDEELLARIRPMVMEILEQELTRFQRQQG
jgi:hypothetical protein